jgi:hypothetical protein
MQDLDTFFVKPAYQASDKPARRPACPLCHGSVKRVRRSLLDRLRGLFMRRGHARYRYRCTAPACSWSGGLSRGLGERNIYGAGGSRRHVLGAARL